MSTKKELREIGAPFLLVSYVARSSCGPLGLSDLPRLQP